MRALLLVLIQTQTNLIQTQTNQKVLPLVLIQPQNNKRNFGRSFGGSPAAVGKENVRIRIAAFYDGGRPATTPACQRVPEAASKRNRAAPRKRPPPPIPDGTPLVLHSEALKGLPKGVTPKTSWHHSSADGGFWTVDAPALEFVLQFLRGF